VNYFLKDLELDTEDVSKMIRTSPLVLAHGLEGKIVPVMDVLRGSSRVELSLGGGSWRSIVVRYPHVFPRR